MTENNPEIVEPTKAETEEKTNFFKSFVTKHPRVARVAGITAAAATIVGIVVASKGMKDDDSLELGAGNDALELNPSTETTLVTEA